jgi:hypothetical protein
MEIPTHRPGRCLSKALVPAAVVAQAAGEEMAAVYLAVAVLVRDKDRGQGPVTADSAPEQGEGMVAQVPETVDPGRENRVGASAKPNLEDTME